MNNMSYPVMLKKIIYLFFFIICLASNIYAQPQSVVCLHGFMRDYRSMSPLGTNLSNAGFDVCVWDYPSRKYTIKEHAQRLLPILQAIAQAKPGIPIHFVSHSLGSLILRTTLNMPNCPIEAKIGNIVLLAPPNKGSALARSVKDNGLARLLLGNRSGRELMSYEESDIINLLGSYPLTAKVLVIAGSRGMNVIFPETNDGILCISETTLNTPFYYYQVYTAHGKMLKCCCIINLIRQFLIEYQSCCSATK